MAQRTRYDWNHLFLTWQRIKADTPGITLKKFADDSNIRYDTMRISFKRIQDRRTTERTRVLEMAADADGTTSIPIDHLFFLDLHDKTMQLVINSFKRVQFLQIAEQNITPETAADLKACVGAVSETIHLIREIHPYIIELRDNDRLKEILTRLLERKIDLSQAAIEISMLGCTIPEAVKIMLAKVPAVMISNSFEIPPSGDDLDQRALETLEQVKWQLESFIPQRRQEVIELKQELKGADSFKQDVAGSSGKGGDDPA